MIKKYGNLCWYCLNEFEHNELTIDHIVPEASGGESTMKNYALACCHCNESKDTMNLIDFIEVANFENRINEIQEDYDYSKIEQAIQVYVQEQQLLKKGKKRKHRPIR